MPCLLELSCTILGFCHQEESLLAFFAHILLAINEILHDLLEFLLEGISLPLQQIVPLPRSCDLLFVQLQVPKLASLTSDWPSLADSSLINYNTTIW